MVRNLNESICVLSEYLSEKISNMKTFKILVLTFVAMTFTANMAFSQATAQVQEADNSKTITVKVKGVGCGEDIKSIAANVEKLEGVSSCKTLKKGAITKFEIIMSPSLVTEKEIQDAIEDTAGCKNPADRPYKVKL